MRTKQCAGMGVESLSRCVICCLELAGQSPVLHIHFIKDPERLRKASSQVRWSGIRLILVADRRREMASEPLPRAWCPDPCASEACVPNASWESRDPSTIPPGTPLCSALTQCHCSRSAQGQVVESSGEHVRSKFLFRGKFQVTKKSQERVSCVSPPGRYRLGRTQQ